MATHPLDPAFAKIERAKTHIKDLKAAVSAFLGSRPYRIVSQVNDKGTEEVWSLAIDPLPSVIESIAADAIHNLRTPLDKMLTSDFRHPALHTHSAKVGTIKFPAADHVNGFQAILARQAEHLTAPVVDFLCTTQPYRGGAGHLAWAINQLDNRDKHRALLEPIKLGFSTTEHREIRVTKGFPLRLGSRRGKHLTPVPDAMPGAWHMHQPVEELKPILRLTPLTVREAYLEFTAPYNDMEIATTTPGAHLRADIQPALDIAFSDIEGVEGEPVVKALEMMREAVEKILTDFRAALFP